MKFIIYILFLTLLPSAAGLTAPQEEADDVLGIYWSPAKTGKIEIYKRGNKYYGKAISGNEARLDTKNPDPNLRSRKVVGMEFLKDFVFDGDDEWEDGTVYDPDSGKTYSCKMWLEKGDLMVKGYIGVSLLGRTEKFERVR